MLEKKIVNAISAFNMRYAYDSIIIGFSGGADSSALLHFFKDKAKKLVAVHINHMIRGEEADRDEAFCVSVCKKYGIEISCHKIDIPALARKRGQGLELVAREERYRIFEEERQKHDCNAILTAHNANDNTESVIFNLTRGSGLNGLSGINPNLNEKIYRPLIYVAKDEIISYCSDNNIEYVTDATNSDTDYTRNYIRHVVVPALERLNPSLNDSVARMTGSARIDNEFIMKSSEDFVKDFTKDGRIELEAFNSLHPAVASRVLKLVSKRNLDYKSILSCIELAKNSECGSAINIADGISFKKEHTFLAFVKTSDFEKIEFYKELAEGENKIDEINEIIMVSSKLEGKEPYYKIKLNKASISGKLYVRSRKEADKIFSGKMNKKVKKLLCEKHIESHLRDKIPFICDDNGILVIPGVAVRDGIKGSDFEINLYKI